MGLFEEDHEGGVEVMRDQQIIRCLGLGFLKTPR